MTIQLSQTYMVNPFSAFSNSFNVFFSRASTVFCRVSIYGNFFALKSTQRCPVSLT